MTFLVVEALERTVAVSLAGVTASESAALSEAWSGCAARLIAEAPAGCAVVRARVGIVDAETVASGEFHLVADTFAELAERLAGIVTEIAITARRLDLVMLHAAAVADPVTGRAIGLVGPSGRGKSTAARVLSREFVYVTDETLAVDDDAGVVPYRRPIGIRPSDYTGAAHKRQIAPPLRDPAEPIAAVPRLARLALLDRRDAPTTARVNAISLADAAPELFAQISFLDARPAPLRRIARLVDGCGGLVVLTYSDAADLPRLVRGLLAVARDTEVPTAAVPGRPEDAAAHPHDGRDLPARSPRASTARVFGRAEVDDWVCDDDAVLVLRGGAVRVLRGLGRVLWLACVRPAAIEDLVATAVVHFGAHPGGSEGRLVRRALEALVDAGLLCPDGPRNADSTAGSTQESVL